MELGESVMTLLRQHPLVRRVKLVGSRQRHDATLLSDWDFEVECDDFVRLREELPDLVEQLRPLGKQWDRLSRRWNYMLLLPGPAKVDVILNHPHEEAGPWEPNPDNLREIDHHFWDWILWLGGKKLRGSDELVANELTKMSQHLLRPLGVETVPSDVDEAVHLYRGARRRAEAAFGVAVDLRIEEEVTRALISAGFGV